MLSEILGRIDRRVPLRPIAELINLAKTIKCKRIPLTRRSIDRTAHKLNSSNVCFKAFSRPDRVRMDVVVLVVVSSGGRYEGFFRRHFLQG